MPLISEFYYLSTALSYACLLWIQFLACAASVEKKFENLNFNPRLRKMAIWISGLRETAQPLIISLHASKLP
jgi:hypothetical protein